MVKYGGNPVYNKQFSVKGVRKKKQSLYIPFCTIKPRKDGGVKKDLLKYGIISHKKPIYDYFVAEFDENKKAEPHFHVWRASQEGARISDTRSEGISLVSGTSLGVVTTRREDRDKIRLTETEKGEIIEFVSENRKALFMIEYAYAHGIKLECLTFDEEVLSLNFSADVLKKIEREYKIFLSQKYLG